MKVDCCAGSMTHVCASLLALFSSSGITDAAVAADDATAPLLKSAAANGACLSAAEEAT
jgi:hypothetical protein